MKKLSGDTFIYGVSAMSLRLISFIIFPLFAKKFDPADYGIINILNSLMFFLTTFSSLGLDGAVARWYYESELPEYRKRIVTNWTIGVFGMSLITVLITLLAFMSFRFHSFFDTRAGKELVYIVCLNVLLFILPNMQSGLLNLERKAKTSAVISVISAVLSTGFSLLLVFHYELGLKGFYLGQTLSWVVISLVAIVRLRKQIRYTAVDLKELKEMIRFGISFVPANISAQLMLFVNGLILLHITSQSELGLFQVGNTLAMALMIFILPFNSAFQPFSFAIMNDDNAGRIYSMALDAYTAIVASGALLIGLFFKEVVELLLKPSYFNSFLIASVLTFANLIYGTNIMASIGMSKTKKVFYFGTIVSIGNLLNIPLTYLLANWVGIEGAALSILLIQSTIIVLLFYYSQKLFYIPFDFRRNGMLVVLSLFFFMAGYLTIQKGLAYSFEIRLLLFFIYATLGIGMHRTHLVALKRALA